MELQRVMIHLLSDNYRVSMKKLTSWERGPENSRRPSQN